jgi:hypothetical protein
MLFNILIKSLLELSVATLLILMVFVVPNVSEVPFVDDLLSKLPCDWIDFPCSRK